MKRRIAETAYNTPIDFCDVLFLAFYFFVLFEFFSVALFVLIVSDWLQSRWRKQGRRGERWASRPIRIDLAKRARPGRNGCNLWGGSSKSADIFFCFWVFGLAERNAFDAIRGEI